MLLFIFEDEHGWIYEPHGSEIEVWCTTFEGSEVLKASGWRPYEMHRVSRYVHDSLLIDGLLQRSADLQNAEQATLLAQSPLNLRDTEPLPTCVRSSGEKKDPP